MNSFFRVLNIFKTYKKIHFFFLKFICVYFQVNLFKNYSLHKLGLKIEYIRLPEYAAEKSSPLSLKLKSFPFYNFSIIRIVQQMLPNRRDFFSFFVGFSERPNKPAFQNFRNMLIDSYMKSLRYFSHVVTTTMITKFVDVVTFFLGWKKHLCKFHLEIDKYTKLFLNELSLKTLQIRPFP